jgi:hypothetical protein
MKCNFFLAAILLFSSCNQHDSSKKENQKKDTSLPGPSIATPDIKPDSTFTDIIKKDSNINRRNADTVLLMAASTKILNYIKAKNYEGLASSINPKLGLRFSPYAYIDTLKDQVLSPSELMKYGKNQKTLNWGYYDGYDDSLIKLNISNYFATFVYDKDFLHAEKRSINKFIGGGNSLNNLKEVYPEDDFTEFYFPGFDPKYGGMDWRTLRLVFKIEKKKLYLVAIIHDEWTI